MINLHQKAKKHLETIAQICTDRGLKLSCAESCTGGGLAFVLTEVAGASKWFEQSFVTYANSAKTNLVAVPQLTLNTHGAVSVQTVEAMALGVCKTAHADIGIAISGIAGPDGGSPEKPVGTVWFGLATANQVVAERVVFAGDRTAVRVQAIEHALAMIALSLDA